eukprot:GHVT01097209.1.p2 GENE.GHVT01097209.1~~GHVT01097209.1.p2  ORF type:complete len:156 (+),score=23.74 GHVT01097209.1:847-1314(+)
MAPPAGNGAGRVPGSFPPLTPLSAPNSSTLKASALRIGKPRHDGRRLQEMRNIYMRVGPVPGASGSSYITLGNTKLTCIVEGPRPAGASAQPNRGSVSLDLRVASCALKDLRTVGERGTQHSKRNSLAPLVNGEDEGQARGATFQAGWKNAKEQL